MKKTFLLFSAYCGLTLTTYAHTNSDVSDNMDQSPSGTFNEASLQGSVNFDSFQANDNASAQPHNIMSIINDIKGGVELDLDAKMAPGELEHPELYSSMHLEALVMDHIFRKKAQKKQPRKTAKELAKQFAECQSEREQAIEFANKHFGHLDDFSMLTQDDMDLIREHPLANIIFALCNVKDEKPEDTSFIEDIVFSSDEEGTSSHSSSQSEEEYEHLSPRTKKKKSFFKKMKNFLARNQPTNQSAEIDTQKEESADLNDMLDMSIPSRALAVDNDISPIAADLNDILDMGIPGRALAVDNDIAPVAIVQANQNRHPAFQYWRDLEKKNATKGSLEPRASELHPSALRKATSTSTKSVKASKSGKRKAEKREKISAVETKKDTGSSSEKVKKAKKIKTPSPRASELHPSAISKSPKLGKR
jgi:hypothetical protein